jgi:hypothetical protein
MAQEDREQKVTTVEGLENSVCERGNLRISVSTALGAYMLAVKPHSLNLITTDVVNIPNL